MQHQDLKARMCRIHMMKYQHIDIGPTPREVYGDGIKKVRHEYG